MVDSKNSTWTQIGRFFVRLTAAVVRHDTASLAAVISFYAFFSLFPLILLIVYGVSVFHPHMDIDKLILSLIRPYFPAIPQSKQLIDENIAHLAVAGAKVGLLSAVTLTWSATSGFIAVQQAMDVIWESQQRSFLTRRLISFGMLVILMLLTLGSTIVLAIYSVVKNVAVLHPKRFVWIHWIHGMSSFVFPFSLFLVCLVFYHYLPSRKTTWATLIPGALLATLALDEGRQMFVWYAGHLVRYQMIYGGLAAVMLLVLWMYIGSMIILFGAEVSAALEETLKESSP